VLALVALVVVQEALAGVLGVADAAGAGGIAHAQLLVTTATGAGDPALVVVVDLRQGDHVEGAVAAELGRHVRSRALPRVVIHAVVLMKCSVGHDPLQRVASPKDTL